MGITPSKEYLLPSGKNFIISYCKIYNIDDSKLDFYFDKKFDINLSHLIDHFTCNLILIPFYHKIHNIGYSIKESNCTLDYKNPLSDVILNIIKSGIPTSSGEILDVTIKSKCYYPTIDNIRYHLYNGNILIAGLVIDTEFIKIVLKSDDYKENEVFSDIVLIVGFDDTRVLIKTNWNKDIIYVPNSFLENFREIWNIEIESPEDIYLNKILE